MFVTLVILSDKQTFKKLSEHVNAYFHLLALLLSLKTITNMNDDVCIKRKLMFDGGWGDDSRLKMLQKMIARWVLTKYNSNEDNQITYNRICYQLSILEHSNKKSQLVQKKYQEELSRYQKYLSEMEQNIKNITKAIESSKILLLEVKNIKHRKINYEMIAKNISVEPSRQETSSYIGQLQQNLSTMKATEKKLDDEWCIWKKHGAVITASSIQLQSLMEQSMVAHLN